MNSEPPDAFVTVRNGTPEFHVRAEGHGAIAVDGTTWPYVRGPRWFVAAPSVPPTLGGTVIADAPEVQAEHTARYGEALVMSPMLGGDLRDALVTIIEAAAAHRAPEWPLCVDGAPFDLLAAALLLLSLGAVDDADDVRVERIGDTLRIDAPRARIGLTMLAKNTPTKCELAFAPSELAS